MAMSVDRQPINRVAIFILAVRVPFMMPHVHRVVHRLRKTTRDRLRDSKQTIQELGTEKRIMNEIVPHPVDVRVDHQRVKEPENQHHPQRRIRKDKVKSQKIRETKKPSRSRENIPARMRE